MSNCAYIEGMKLVNSNCNCTSYFAEEEMYGMGFCHGKGLHCKLSIARDLFNSVAMNATRKCLPHCERQDYQVTETFAAYPKKLSFRKRRDICYIFKKLVRICGHQYKAKSFEATYKRLMTCRQIKNADKRGICKGNKYHEYIDTGLEKAILTYAKENIAYVKAYIKVPYYKLTTHDVQIPMSQFIGNLGGLMGGLLGMSAISILEIIFFLALCFQSSFMFLKRRLIQAMKQE